jgi:hypothetical protein
MPKDHGKKDAKAIAKDRARDKMKQIAKERPGGESARELARQDIEQWKGNK